MPCSKLASVLLGIIYGPEIPVTVSVFSAALVIRETTGKLLLANQ